MRWSMSPNLPKYLLPRLLSFRMRLECQWLILPMRRRRTDCTRLQITSCALVNSDSTARSSSVLGTTRKLWHSHQLSQLSTGRTWLRGTLKSSLSSVALMHHLPLLWATTAIKRLSTWRSAKNSKTPKSSRPCKWLAYSRMCWQRQDQKKERIKWTKVFRALKSSRISSSHRMILISTASLTRKARRSSTKARHCKQLRPTFPSATSKSASRCLSAPKSYTWLSTWPNFSTLTHSKKSQSG